MKSYHFAILRYVHNGSTEEFVNIGVVMWIPERSKLIFGVNERFGRLSGFFKDLNGSSYREMVRNLKSVSDEVATNELFQDTPENPLEIFNKIVREDASCFQWSRLMSGISTDPEERFNQLYEEFVTFHESFKSPQRRSESVIWKGVRQALKKRHLESRVQFNVKVEATDFDYLFKMGWNNGTRQVLEPISLAYRYPAEIVHKANTWSGRLFNLSKDNDFGCTIVLAPPGEHVNMTIFNQGFAILKGASSIRKIITEDEVNDYMSEIEKDLST
jgi:hypothetical protein